MDLVNEALRAPAAPPPPTRKSPRAVLVVGGGGVLGAAVLEQLLGCGGFAPVRVLVTRPFKGSVSALRAIVPTPFDDERVATQALSDVAVVVFDRARHANGRDDAFARVEPQALPVLAGWLRRQAVRDVVVVMPHGPVELPQALKLGLANLDEHAVAAQGFEHVVFVRSAQRPGDGRGGPWLQRVADWMLRQLQLMLPVTQQPVQVHKVARFVAELAVQLPDSAPGTRVASPELVWQAAQQTHAGRFVADWLAGAELPPSTPARPRL